MYYSFLLISIVIPTRFFFSFSAFLAPLDVCKALRVCEISRTVSKTVDNFFHEWWDLRIKKSSSPAETISNKDVARLFEIYPRYTSGYIRKFLQCNPQSENLVENIF